MKTVEMRKCKYVRKLRVRRGMLSSLGAQPLASIPVFPQPKVVRNAWRTTATTAKQSELDAFPHADPFRSNLHIYVRVHIPLLEDSYRMERLQAR